MTWGSRLCWLGTICLSLCFVTPNIWASGFVNSANSLNPASAAKPKLTVTFGYNPSESSEAAELSATKFTQYFKEKISLNIKPFVASDYTGLIEALRSKRLDFAWMPPFSFVKAEKMADAVPLMKSVYRGGSATVYGAIIARRDRGFRSIEDLKGKNIAWVDPSSATGHIFPKATLMRKYNVDPEKYFRRQIFAGGHDAVVLAVLNGRVDAGATYMATEKGDEGAWRHFLSPGDQDKIQILMTSDPITSDLVVTTKKFQREHPEVVAQFVKVLSEMGDDPVGGPLLRELYKIDRLIPATSADYDNVREAARLLKLN